MGHSPSKVAQIPTKTFTPDVEVVEKNHSTPFGEVTVVRDKKTNQEMYQKTITLQDEESFESQLSYYFKRVNNAHTSLVNVIGYTSDHQSSFCSDSYKINLYLDAFPRSLDAELTARITAGDLISEIELQLLAEQLISVLTNLQQKEVAHGEIRPENVFITEEAYKLYDPTFSTQAGLKFNVQSLLVNTKALLAPELFNQLSKEKSETQVNKFKADVFSLGATLLSISTLSRSEDLYNFEENTIDYNLLNARLERVEATYSPSFSKLLRELLEVNPENRPDFVDLNSRLNIQVAIGNFYFSQINKSAVKAPYVKVAAEIGDVINSQTFVAHAPLNSALKSRTQSRRTYSEVSIPQSRTNIDVLTNADNLRTQNEYSVRKTYIPIDSPLTLTENLRLSVSPQTQRYAEVAKKSSLPETYGEAQPLRLSALPITHSEALTKSAPPANYYETENLQKSTIPETYNQNMSQSYNPIDSKATGEIRQSMAGSYLAPETMRGSATPGSYLNNVVQYPINDYSYGYSIYQGDDSPLRPNKRLPIYASGIQTQFTSVSNKVA